MACPVCFGGDDTLMRESLNAGIGVLMGVTAIVLACFAALLREAGAPSTARGASGIQHSIADRQSTITNDSVIDERKSMISMLDWLGLPVAASAHAGEVDRIMALVHWLMLVLFVGWSVFFVYVLLRFRSGAHPRADYRGVRGGWSNWVEGGVLVAEIVLLAFFSIPFWSANVDAAPPPENQPPSCASSPSSSRGTCTTRAPTACSAARTFASSSPTTRSDSIATNPSARTTSSSINGCNLPVGRPVIVYLSSKDVIHSFGTAADAREAGRHPGHRAARLVHSDENRPVGHRVLAALRPRALPHERRLSDPDAGGLSGLAEGRRRHSSNALVPVRQSTFTRLHADPAAPDEEFMNSSVTLRRRASIEWREWSIASPSSSF